MGEADNADLDGAEYAWEALSVVRRTADVLRPLFASALESWSLEVALTLWCRLGEPLAAPFEFYLERPDAFGELGLHPRPLIAPLTRSDQDVLRLPIFDGKHAREVRKPIRLGLAARVEMSRSQAERERAMSLAAASNRRTDWERAIVMRSDRLPARSPAVAFQGLDLISRDGSAKRTPRPVIGRYASRKHLRDQVLAIWRGPLTGTMTATAATCDCAFLNIQGVRGRNTLDLVRRLVRLVPNCPGLLIAAAPSELFELAEGGWPAFKRVHLVGSQIAPFNVGILPVAREREQLDRRFAATTEGLADYSAVTARLFDIAKSAWWAAMRSVTTDEDTEPAVFDYLRSIAVAAQKLPEDVARFRSFTEALLAVLHDESRANERRHALLRAVAEGAETVLVPNPGTRRVLLDREPELRAKQVRCITANEAWRAAPPTHLAVLGIAGAPSLDALIALRPRRMSIIVDPVEARVAVAFLAKWTALLRGYGGGQPALDQLLNALEAVAAPSRGESGVVDLKLGNYTSGGISGHGSGTDASPADLVRVRFVDGSNLICARATRFDVVSEDSNRLDPRTAAELQPGDEVVVVASEDARAFSEHLIDALDQGKLSESFAHRKALLRLIRRAAEEHSLGARAIARSLARRGIRVSPEAVGGWLRGAAEDATVANTRRNLEALLEVLLLDLPTETVDIYWTAVRVVRIGHRLAGRQVVHAIRAAAAGRLSAQTMFSIEREYGWSIRQLIEAAHAQVVDEVTSLDG
jgi:hypothetical protein